MMKTALLTLSALAAALLPSALLAQGMPMVELAAGIHRIEAEVAHTQPNRQLGLMHRRTMAPQRGMLFVFDKLDRHCMWMRNTLLPLAVAFLDEEGRIINVEEMQPQTENNHCAERPARYALEMNGGWFMSRGLGAGAPIAGVDKAPAPR